MVVVLELDGLVVPYVAVIMPCVAAAPGRSPPALDSRVTGRDCPAFVGELERHSDSAARNDWWLACKLQRTACKGTSTHS